MMQSPALVATLKARLPEGSTVRAFTFDAGRTVVVEVPGYGLHRFTYEWGEEDTALRSFIARLVDRGAILTLGL